MTRRLVDVARKVGVSEATVSRVLNDKPGVSESTRQAILTGLDVLGYELPTVLVNAPIEGLGFATVSCDDASAAEQAVGHLLSLGHTRIGLLLGPTDHIPSRRKLAAARATADRAGLPIPNSRIVHSLYSL